MDPKVAWPHLQELSSLLESLPSRPEGPGHKEEFINAPDYLEALDNYYEAYKSSTGQHAGQQIVGKVKLLKSPPKQIDILSIGCGYCDYELPILSHLQEAFPDLSITFYGVDVDQTSCAIAEEKLAKLPYKVTILKENFTTMDISTLPRFDFVLSLRSHYYFPDKKALLEKAMSLLKPGTGRVELILEDEGTKMPVWKLPGVFNGKQDKVMATVKEMGLDYTSSTCDGYVHFDRCIKEGFDSRYGRKLMNHLCKTTIQDYPPEVRAACVAHIKSVMDEEQKCYVPEMHISILAWQN